MLPPPFLLRALTLALAMSCADAAAASPQAGSLWLQASVDHADSGLVVRVLRDEAGWYYLRRIDARMLELPLQDTPALRFEDEDYLRIDALAGHRLLLDEDRQRAHFLSPEASARPAAPAALASTPTPTPESAPAAAPAATAASTQPSESPGPVDESAQAQVAPDDGVPLAPNPAAPQPTPPAPFEDEILLLDIVVNGQAVPGVWQARRVGSDLLLEAALLEAAGIVATANAGASSEVSLARLSGGRFTLDPTSLQLDMTVPAEHLRGSRFDLDDGFVPGPPPKDLSAILGYALSATHADGRSRAAGLLDLVLSRGRASCGSSHAWRQGHGLRRLDTGCRVDWPERLLTVELGDSLAPGARLQPGVRFSGVRVGTDFGLNPYLRTLPDFSLQGSARLPSTLELWIDQQLALRTEVPPGPFDIRDIPAHTGSGELRAVVTDALGRQSVIGAPLFVDPRLLRPGLLDWSAEAGRLRLGHAGDASYGERFAAFAARRGMNEGLTADLRGEAWAGGGSVGLGGVMRLGGRGLLELGIAASAQDGGRGHAWQLGYSLRGERLSFGLRHTQHTRDFASLAWREPGEAPARLSQANLGLALPRAQLNLAWIDRRRHDGAAERFATAAVSFLAFGRASVSLSLSHAIGHDEGTSIGLFVSLPLDGGLSSDASLRHGDDGLEASAGLRRQVPLGPGLGWQARARHAQGEAQLALDALWRSGWSDIGLALDHGPDGTALRGDLSGSLVAAAGGVFAARREPGSYAVVNAGTPGVRVLRDNQVIAITDARGRALVPGLRPFQRNPLRLAMQDLPLGAQVGHDGLELVPGRRQAIAADFGVRHVRYLSTRLQFADGSAPPAGAQVQIEGAPEAGFLGYAGELFIELPDQPLLRITAQWNGSRCSASALIDGGDAAVVELERLTCTRDGEP